MTEYEYSTSPPTVSHLSDRLNNQEIFNSWWNWRLCNKYLGGSTSIIPPIAPIPCESFVDRKERFRIWNQLAEREDQLAKRRYMIQKIQKLHSH